MFNAAGGSILIAMLFHWQLNNPIWPDAQPWDTPLFAALALTVVWLNRRTMFTRGTGAIAVIPPSGRGSFEQGQGPADRTPP